MTTIVVVIGVAVLLCCGNSIADVPVDRAFVTNGTTGILISGMYHGTHLFDPEITGDVPYAISNIDLALPDAFSGRAAIDTDAHLAYFGSGAGGSKCATECE
jgi:hypothetical protein